MTLRSPVDQEMSTDQFPETNSRIPAEIHTYGITGRDWSHHQILKLLYAVIVIKQGYLQHIM